MPDSFTTVTHHSWGGRLSSSIKGIVCGFVAVLIGIGLLVWNEGNSVAAHKSLKEAQGLCMEVPTIDSIDPSLESKLVHASGMAVPETTVFDALFQVYPSTPALKLKREVEMYQWTESKTTKEKKNAGGSSDTETTYSYHREWVNHAVDSNAFEYTQDHENPSEMLFPALTQNSSPVHMGAFGIPDIVMNKINWFVPLPSNYSLSYLPDDMVGQHKVSLYENQGYYFGQNQYNPAVGDTRVHFSYVPQQVISVIARQTGSSFSNFITSNQRTVLLVEPGYITTEEMFLHANQQVTVMTWILRLIGFLLLWSGFNTVAKPVSTLADVVPFIGNLLEAGASLISFLLALVVATIVIAISWLFNRPFLSLFLLGGVGGIVYYIWKKRRGENVVAVAYAISATDDLELQGTDFK